MKIFRTMNCYFGTLRKYSMPRVYKSYTLFTDFTSLENLQKWDNEFCQEHDDEFLYSTFEYKIIYNYINVDNE